MRGIEVGWGDRRCVWEGGQDASTYDEGLGLVLLDVLGVLVGDGAGNLVRDEWAENRYRYRGGEDRLVKKNPPRHITLNPTALPRYSHDIRSCISGMYVVRVRSDIEAGPTE